AGFAKIRRIRAMSFSDIVSDMNDTTDSNKQGEALEILAIRLCQMLELDFMGWRETDVEIAGGGEVDAMFYSTRLVYSRWQIQCKLGGITAATVMKEMGQQLVSLSNVILIVSNGTVTDGAHTYRKKIITTSNLHIVFIDGAALERIIKDNSALIDILRQQAQYAMSEKPMPQGLRLPRPNDGSDSGSTPAKSEPRAGEPARAAGEPTLFTPAYSTDAGQMFCGDAFEILPALIRQGIR